MAPAYPQSAATSMYPPQYYTPFNPTQLPSPDPLSQVTVALAPPNSVRPLTTVCGTPMQAPAPVSLPNPLSLYNPAAVAAAMMVNVPLVTPSAIAAPPPAQPPSFNDANNDVSSWTEHEGADGRKYWHNRVTQVSRSSSSLPP
jgi:hypothetical protein